MTEYPEDLGTQARQWLETQPKGPNGKVTLGQVITESKRRGYCICPKPIRAVINFDGCTCLDCFMPETRQSWEFWYQK